MSNPACGIIERKVKELNESLKYAFEHEDFVKIIQLDAQVKLLQDMWVDFLRLDKPKRRV